MEIKEDIKYVLANTDLSKVSTSFADMIAWLEKQGTKESKKTSIWNHWKNGIAGNGEGKLIYLIKCGDDYSLSSSLGHECDYVLLSDLDKLMLEEKQGEQRSTDKVEPKFKVGDWIVNNNGEPRVFRIEKQKWPDSIISSSLGNHIINTFTLDKQYHLWTIQDAKDGDVLYHKSPLTGIEYIVMSKGINGFGNIDSYFRYNSEDGFGTYIPSVFNAKSDDITPATKEQRDFLFQEMKEAGYEWDVEKKELRKIEENPAFCHHEVDLSGCSEEYRKAYYDGWNNCNQQHSQLKAEQKPVWSKEDEKLLNLSLENLTELKNRFGEKYGKVGDCILWLKSFKERYGWKPTDEQMKQLGWVAEQNKDNMIGKELMSLYQELKKLKGE